jgi:hypothetical protein
VSIIFVGVTLGGCALFTEDVRYDYSQIVARMGAIEINKKQLIDGYNSFGYQYVSEQGMSLQDAYDKTAEQLIDREAAVLESIRLYGDLTDAERAAARKTSYDGTEKAFREYEKEIRDKKFPLAAGAAETPTTEEQSAEGVTYKPFEKFIEYKNQSYVLNLEKYKTTADAEYIYENDDAFIEYLKTPRTPTNAERAITTEAFNKLARVLQSVEKGVATNIDANGKMFFTDVKYDTDQQKIATVYRELKRMQFEEGKNILLRRLQDMFNWGLAGVTADYQTLKNLQQTDKIAFEHELNILNDQFVAETVRKATANFTDKVRDARYRLAEGFDSTADYYSKILENLSTLYYAPETVASQFFTVSHILLQYTEEQKTEYSDIKSRFEGDKNVANRDRDLENLANAVTTQKTIDGVKTGETMTANEVLQYIKSWVNPFSQTKTLAAKQKSFQEMIYMFNADPGMQNPEFEYVIGRDRRTDRGVNSTETEEMSKMVPEFTARSRMLFNYDETLKRGGYVRAQDYVKIFNVDKSIFKNAEYEQNKYVSTLGTMTDLVWTDYGAHIIMYTRNIADILFTASAALTEQIAPEYMHRTFTSYGNKTYFDAAVESVTKPAYNQYEEQLLRDFKTGKTVELKRGAYKNLTKA